MNDGGFWLQWVCWMIKKNKKKVPKQLFFPDFKFFSCHESMNGLLSANLSQIIGKIIGQKMAC